VLNVTFIFQETAKEGKPMKRFIIGTVMLAGFLVGVFGTPAFAQNIRADLEGFEEVPAVSSGAKGQFRGRIRDKGTAIDYTLSYSGLEETVSQAHIHFGQQGVVGGISVWLCETTAPFEDPANLAPTCPQEGQVKGTLTAANVIGPSGQGIAAQEFDELIRAIRNGVAYVNVHSLPTFGGGEIRGHIK
jgi:hypothetical protein